MSQPYSGEIRMGGWNFAPENYAMCNGVALSISQNETLYTLLGTTYGGDGVTTFNLPDMRSRMPVHMGNNFVQGQVGGSESVTLTTAQIPNHNHQILASGAAGTKGDPFGLAPAKAPSNIYNAPGNPTPMAPVMGPYGGSQPHENRMPYLAITFVIALYGIYPSRN